MKIVDLYSTLLGNPSFDIHPDFKFLDLDPNDIREWMLSPVAIEKRETALAFLKEASSVVKKVESVFGRELPGVLVFMPSFGDFDGFARYDSGEHRVMLGIDFPDADVDYLKALTAHELSHVYRDHSPKVWAHLGKPLKDVKRREYLDAATAQEHLVSEGLATLFSAALFPQIAPEVHHYYEKVEWEWIQQNDARIEDALMDCLRGDEDVWSFYGEGRAGPGSPSRLQYYWAAKKLRSLIGEPQLSLRELISLHEKPAQEFPLFHLKA